MADLNAWWNTDWQGRSVINTPLNGSPHQSGVHFVRLDADLATLISQELLRSDYADLRVVCQKPTHNINVPLYVADGPTPNRVFFAIQHDAGANENISHPDNGIYYLYYGNGASYTSEQSDDYLNINFPKAPYSCHPSGHETAYGTYLDKHFLRLSDSPASHNGIFEDCTNHGSGISRHHQNIQPGHSGILDQSTYFDPTYTSEVSGSFIEIPQNEHNHWGHPSGNWSVDFWVYPMPHGSVFYPTHNIFCKLKQATPVAEQEKMVYVWWGHSLAGVGSYRTEANCLFTSQRELRQQVNTGYIPMQTWRHFRMSYRTGGGYLHSKIHIYMDGELVNALSISDNTNNVAEDTTFFAGDPTSCWLGRLADNTAFNNAGTFFKGYLEQFRYSTFVLPAISGTGADELYMCRPDWIDNQYIGYLGTTTLYNQQSGIVGGAVLSESPYSEQSGFVGAYVLGRMGQDNSVGGHVWALSPVQSGFMGGIAFCLAEASGTFGGISLGSYGDIDLHSIESLNRGLIKANNEIVPDQAFGANSLLTLYGQATDEFDATVTVQSENHELFDGRMNITKIQLNPYVEIIEETSDYDGYNLPATYTIAASGRAYSNQNQPYSSGIHSVTIIWGDNDYTDITNPVTSGDVWSATHTYSHSGVYKPIVIVKDSYGRAGSANADLNLASGLTLDEIPGVSLSGLPRTGYVPNQLAVDLTAATSGVVGSHTLYWDYGNGITQYNNAVAQIAYYAMPGNYTPWIRLEDSRGIYVCDTLKIGYNR